MVDGFVVEVDNFEVQPGVVTFNTERTGYVGSQGTASELHDPDPRVLDGVESNWIATIRPDTTGLFFQSPYDYELQWVNPADSTYRPPRFGIGYLSTPINVFSINTSENVLTELLIRDTNNNREFDVDDVAIISERDGVVRKFRYRISFRLPEGEASIPPAPGTVLRITPKKEFRTGDYFQFTLRKAVIDTDLAKSELEDIAVVPNPYVGGSAFEVRSQISGRGERRLQFINLPQQCTIRIFNLRGELVDTIEHNVAGDNGSAFWDLRTSGSQDVAYGVYIFHVDAPGIGQHVGKFAIVK
jgi:hypothetical protein